MSQRLQPGRRNLPWWEQGRGSFLKQSSAYLKMVTVKLIGSTVAPPVLSSGWIYWVPAGGTRRPGTDPALPQGVTSLHDLMSASQPKPPSLGGAVNADTEGLLRSG